VNTSRTLRVNEIFGPTIQGEGKSAGKKVLFLRLTECNLYCVWCDTPYTWNWKGTDFEHPVKHDKLLETHLMSDEDILKSLRGLDTGAKSLVVSGGEPLIQQKRLASLLKTLHSEAWRVEIETNGTVSPTKDIVGSVSQINCSPKLSSAKIPYNKRIKSNTLAALNSCDKTNFKFVVANNADAQELLALHKEFKFREVYVMAEGQTRAELLQKDAWIRQFCSGHGFAYVERLHILKWGSKRGV
jgi:7-carboxy-7-deazaguanine synthase